MLGMISGCLEPESAVALITATTAAAATQYIVGILAARHHQPGMDSTLSGPFFGAAPMQSISCQICLCLHMHICHALIAGTKAPPVLHTLGLSVPWFACNGALVNLR